MSAIRQVGNLRYGALLLGLLLALTPMQTTHAETLSATDPHFQIRRTLIRYPPIERVRPAGFSRWNYQMCQVDCSHITTREAAEALAEQLDQRGFNLVLIGAYANMYLFRDPGDDNYVANNPPFPELVRNAALLAEALHKHRIKAMMHTTCSMVTKQFIDRHPDWASIDQADGKPIFTSSKTYATCVANPAFQNAFLDRLRELLVQTHADGAMVDETSWWSVSGCVCAYCRAAFQRDTGLDLPASGSGTAFFNANNPAYQTFLDWRRRVKLEFDQRVSSLVWQECGPQAWRPTYTSNPLWPILSWIGMLHTDWLLCADNIGYECEPPGHLYLFHWPHLIAELKLKQAMARHTPGAPWSLFYYRLKGDPVFCWLLAMSQGSRVWWRDLPEEEPLRNWEINHQTLWENTRPLANVGVLYAPTTIDRQPNGLPVVEGLSGVCDALTEQAVPYRMILEQDLTANDFGGVDTIFAMNVANVSLEMAEGLTRFVREGGVLVSSGNISLCDESSRRRPDFLLASVLGVSWRRAMSSDKNDLVLTRPNELTGNELDTLPHNRPFHEVAVNTNAQTVGEIVMADGQRFPGIVIHRFGRGWSVYFAGHPELGNFFTSYSRNLITPGKPWKDERDVRYQRLLASCARFQNTRLPVEVTNVARGIVVEAFRQDSGRLRGVQVHLANLQGGNLQAGIVPVAYDIRFPPLDKPIRLRVRSGNVRRVYLLSPDFDGIVRMPFRKEGEWVQVELRDFARYAILYFSEGDDAPLLTAGGKKLDRIPAARELLQRVEPSFAGEFDPNAVYLFSDRGQITGGNDQIANYKNMPLPQFAYGARTKFSTLRATFPLSTLPSSPILQLGGCDDNAPTKAPMEIRINDQVVFRGPCPFPDDEPGTSQWRIANGILRAGDNIITIQNTGDSDSDGMPPWFMIHFIKIAPPTQ